ncbi:type I toxin-antitoxin system toxin TisB [Salmonella enterica subsp. enterica serovar Poona]|uniref:Type I toxin-antitoxin system toxin TisB n=1 Tax=Salmonella enterica subsp. enterica serovar Poona TaxID=436295 RepID=A0A4Z0PHT0_SALET|nr:type I toxin-antitoxin system toxin TisB [Salmonella enterica subsp. enterica serovar Poona]
MSVVDITILNLTLIVAALPLLDADLKYRKYFRFKPHRRGAGNRSPFTLSAGLSLPGYVTFL